MRPSFLSILSRIVYQLDKLRRSDHIVLLFVRVQEFADRPTVKQSALDDKMQLLILDGWKHNDNKSFRACGQISLSFWNGLAGHFNCAKGAAFVVVVAAFGASLIGDVGQDNG